jgi:hypothetical protein
MAGKRPNTLLGEALLDVEQQKLDYFKQKEASKSDESDNENVTLFFRAYCLTLPKFRPRGNCFSGARFKRLCKFAYEIPRSHPTDASTSAPEFTQQSTGTVQAVPAQFETCHG